MFTQAYVPFRGYWSTPFCRWQMSLQNENAIVLGAATAKKALELRHIPVEALDGCVLGWSVAQKSCFYATPWYTGMMGNDKIGGPIFSQACATSATGVGYAGSLVETGVFGCLLVAMIDRCSNGPHLVWPDPNGPGGKPISEDWVMDNFGHDPYAENAMIETAERVAKRFGLTRQESDELTLDRYQKYQMALADDRAFQKGYMVSCEIKQGKKMVEVSEDEGVFSTTAEGLAKLRPLLPEGVLTFGSQTHPADGNIGLIVTTKQKAEELSADKSITVQLLSYGYSRAEKGHMAMAVLPAAQMAIEKAGVKAADLAAVKTHNPFAVNDIYLGRELKIPEKIFNNYGSSLIFGHPQAPTGGRLIIELIEELAAKGGGLGLFTGCAAGDTGAAVVVKVG